MGERAKRGKGNKDENKKGEENSAAKINPRR
jgi:hypothetical protein